MGSFASARVAAGVDPADGTSPAKHRFRPLAKRLPLDGAAYLIARLFQRAVLFRSVEMAPPSPGCRSLVIAPHPDDEVLACGAAMAARVLAGVGVTVVVVTDGRHSHRSARLAPSELAATRRAESVEACARLGVSDVRFLDLEEHALAAGHDDLRRMLSDQIDDVAPAEVLIPIDVDRHPDHREVSRAAMSLLAGRPGVDVFGYPVWFWDPRSWSERGVSFRRALGHVARGPWSILRGPPSSRVSIGPHRAAKRAALSAYRSQMTKLTDEDDWATFDRRFLALFTGDAEIFYPGGTEAAR